MKVFASWSGGKDCALATYKALVQGYKVACLFTMVSEDGKRSRSHGISTQVLDVQSEAIGIPILKVNSSWEEYEQNFKIAVKELKKEGIEGGVFGDIDVEEHRQWIERVCSELSIQPIMPLWKAEPKTLLHEFQESGFKATIIATSLDEDLLGRDYDQAFMTDMLRYAVHPSGENGEYHTFVTDGPIFKEQLTVEELQREKRNSVWFLEISAKRRSGLYVGTTAKQHSLRAGTDC